MSARTIASIILNFWFGQSASPSYGQYKDFWFQSTPELDQQIRSQFEPFYQQAIIGELDTLSQTPEGSLALVIILDQFPRNMYRETPQAFASDEKALTIAKTSVKKKFDQGLLPIQRTFLYLPYEHSENMEDQEQSVKLFENLGDELALKHAIEHRDVIAQFGRFPHRNVILRRESTPAEIKFLQKTTS